MATTTDLGPTTTTQTTAQGRKPWRFSGKARKLVLLVHIVSAGIWIGVDVIVAVLVCVGWFSSDTQTQATAYQALGLVAVWPMLVSGMVCLVSGIMLGLGSKYGLVRYKWVAVKLVLNVALVVLVFFALRPDMAETVEYGRALGAGTPNDTDISGMFFPPAVSLTALSFAMYLSIFKPWGRTRRR
ncbi:hypothetical protein [Nocardioides speluncae]|uniref:hypothetical protein n=1 Tax=Nocardioides speluncae TaxID=2670337 RepID=UPI001F0C7DB7|nr:hypothetical protein [Nocardioides speluncae]